MDIKLIELNRIQPNGYNPNVIEADILAKLRAEIAQKGLCEPIIVRSSGNGYIIVDGEHRWQVCQDLGWREIPCIIVDYDDTEAKIKTLQLNYLRGSAIPIKLASLIHDLNKEIKLEDLAKRLPYEEILLKNNLELLKLPEDFEQVVSEQARKDAEELPSVISFVLYKKQLETVEGAIQIALEKLPEGAKNLKALALERICADFLERQGVKSETAVSTEIA